MASSLYGDSATFAARPFAGGADFRFAAVPLPFTRSRCRVNGDLLLVLRLPLVLHDAVDEREEREVRAATDVLPWGDRLADLTNEDVAGANCFAAVDLHAASLRVGVATVAR